MRAKSKELINNAAMGARLRKVRMDLNIRLYEIAGDSGICPLSIYEAEIGRGFPRTDYLWYLNMNCHVSIDYILSGWGEPFFFLPEKVANSIEFGEREEVIRPVLDHMIREESVAVVMNKFYRGYIKEVGPLGEVLGGIGEVMPGEEDEKPGRFFPAP